MKTDTFLAITNPQKFSNLYKFHLEIDEFYQKEIFVDSSDFISLILGINDFYKGHELFNIGLFRNKMTMLHSLLFRGYLGTIKLLNPHMFEFTELRFPENPLLNRPLQVNDPIDLIYKLRLINPSEERLSTTSFEDILPYKKLEEEAESRFKLMYLIDQEHPKKRATYLIKNNIISFDTSSNFKVPNITQTPLFRKLFNSLNRLQEGKSINNFHDALALAQLQLKLQEWKATPADSETRKKLPLLYARNKILEAVLEVSQDEQLFDGDQKPFTFSGESGDHLIVQNEDFFLIDALYSLRKVQKTTDFKFGDFFEEITEYYNNISKPEIQEIEKAAKQLSPESDEQKETVQKAIHLDFFKRWWMDEHGEIDLKKTLTKFNQINETKFAKGKFAYVDIEFNRKYKALEQTAYFQNLGLKYAQIAFRPEFMNAIKNKYNENGKLQYNVEQEFMTRFSYPAESVNAIKTFLDRLYSSYKKGDKEENSLLKIEMIIYLQYVMEYTVLRPAENKSPADERKLEQLCTMLSILWIEHEYELLNEFCIAINNTFETTFGNEGQDFYPNYQLGLLHAASLIRLKSEPELPYEKMKEYDEMIDKILNCIENKYGSNSYKVWIGISFINAKRWEAVRDKTSIPEIDNFINPLSKEETSIRQDYYSRSSENSKKAFMAIKQLDSKPSSKHIRDRRYYYAINNYIYMETLNRDLKDFPGDLNKLIKDLEGVASPFFQHERYQDTIARFNQRMAAKIALENPEKIEEYKTYTESALSLSRNAIKKAEANNNTMDIPLFESLVNELTRMSIEGPSYFQN